MINLKLLFDKIFNKDNLKLSNIIQYIIVIIVSLIIGFSLSYFKAYKITKDSIVENNKEIIIEDKEIIDNELKADGKDIIIILDGFNSLYDFHGNDVSNHLYSYFKRYLKKPLDIKIINLSINEKQDTTNIEYLDIMNYNKHLIKINKESYQLDKYIQRIRELNPNSKIVLSLSFTQICMNDKIIELSKKYDYKIAQSNYNTYLKKEWFWIFWRHFIMDRTNTIIVSLQETKPLWYIKQISLDDIKHDKKLENYYNWSTSMLTPILGYEYYLNKESNITNPNLLNNK